MTRGAWMCRQYDDGLKIWLAAPRENEKPFIDSERAQKWRLSLASLLFFTVLLSDHLWFCAEAGGRGTDSRGKPLLPGNSARPAWRLETCYPQGASSGQCFTVDSADAVCARNWSRGAAARGEQGQQTRGPPQPTPLWNLSDFYLSFCNSYTLWELFSGLSSPNTLNCSLDVVLKEGGEMTTCRQCVEAYQDYDHHAQEKYEEFESVLHKYLQSEEYSVKSCPEDCKV
ncbi:Transmembrane protein FAM155A, partial [Bos mutus]